MIMQNNLLTFAQNCETVGPVIAQGAAPASRASEVIGVKGGFVIGPVSPSCPDTARSGALPCAR